MTNCLESDPARRLLLPPARQLARLEAELPPKVDKDEKEARPNHEPSDRYSMAYDIR